MGDWCEHRGEVPPHAARVRGRGLPPRRVQDGRDERARAGGAGRAAGRVRRRVPQAHARARQRAARLCLVRGDRRRLAGGEGEPRAASQVGVTLAWASVPESPLRPHGLGSTYPTYTVRMKISEMIKRLLHRESPTEGELEARAEAAAARAERAADLGEAELLTRKPG